MDLKRWTPVEILWDDAHGHDDGWGDPDPKLHKPERVRTIGLLYKQDDLGVSVYSSRQANGLVGAHTFVPAVNVVSVRELK
jgi:hypothetical protein